MSIEQSYHPRMKPVSAVSSFICHSPAMKQVMELVATVAPTDVAVRIQGESGTGKELVANAPV